MRATGGRVEIRRLVPGVLAGVGVSLLITFGAAATALQGAPKRIEAPFAPPVVPLIPMVTEPAPATETPPPPSDVQPDHQAAEVLQAVLVVIAVIAIATVITLLVRAWRRRRARAPRRLIRAATGAAGAEIAAPIAPATIRRGIDGADAALRSDRAPSDAIVAAWVGLEEAAQDSGLRRGISETPGEFVVRIVARTVGVREAVGVLLDHYQAVRFGGRAADEGDRQACMAALMTIREAWR